MKYMICNRCGEEFKKANGAKLELTMNNSISSPDVIAHLCYGCYNDILNTYMDEY